MTPIKGAGSVIHRFRQIMAWGRKIVNSLMSETSTVLEKDKLTILKAM